MRIGEIAARAGVPPKTIRFWEDQRLLSAPARTPAGYRQYDVSTVERLAFIQTRMTLSDGPYPAVGRHHAQAGWSVAMDKLAALVTG